MRFRKGIFISAVLGGLALIAMTAEAYATYYKHSRSSVVFVRNGHELAAAIEKANANSRLKFIKCVSYRGCSVKGSLPDYTGRQRLKIDGYGSTIDASGITDKDAFAATGGGGLKLVRLSFLGGISGVYVEVPADHKDTVRVELWRVAVKGAALHGVYVNDANAAPAGVRLAVYASHIAGNGFGADSQDGIHVNESGEGRVAARVLYSTIENNGSDGLSLDEEGQGDVALMIAKTRITGNGQNPANPSDPEDGLDIDEADDGDIWLMVHRSRFNGNRDDGIDVDERGGGAIFSLLNQIQATENEDQGLTYDERGDGNFTVKVKDSHVDNNDANSQLIDIRGEQQDGGEGTLTLKNVKVGNTRLSGVELIVLP